MQCRPSFWFWESIVLVQTLAFVASQVLATSLDTYFQLTIMLMVLLVGFAVLAHLQPFESRLAQNTQVVALQATAMSVFYTYLAHHELETMKLLITSFLLCFCCQNLDGTCCVYNIPNKHSSLPAC